MLGRCDGHENVVTFLIEHGADVDLQDKDGDTALHYAASSSLREIVKTFLLSWSIPLVQPPRTNTTSSSQH